MSSAMQKLKTNLQNPFCSHQMKQPSTKIPDDLIFMHVLPRLSYKILSKFKCVSKTWEDVISNDIKFAQDQSLCASPISCGAVFSVCHDYKTEFLDIFGSQIGINPRQPLLMDENLLPHRILASSGGLLCIQFRHNKSTSYSLYICNLAMEEGHIIPAYGCDDFYNVGLAFDPSIEPNCCKIVHPFTHLHPTKLQFEHRFEVYSSDTSKWVISDKVISTRIVKSGHGKPITLRNVVYWDCYEHAISFDPWNDNASYIELPKRETSDYRQELGTCNGRITCTRIINKYLDVYFFYESKNKWERKYRINIDVVISVNQNSFSRFWHMMKTRSGLTFEKLKLFLDDNIFPFPYHGGDKFFFRIHSENTKLVLSYDVKTDKAEKLLEFKFRGLHGRVRQFVEAWEQRIFMYHSSMIKLPSFVK